jgi:DNA-binding transcriptional ArsR family regulator
MTTATVLKTKAVARATKAQRNAALRVKRAQQAAILLKHVSDLTRLRIILLLAEGERYVGALSEAVDQNQPAVSHHLTILRYSGIVARRRQGKQNFYALTGTGKRLASIVKNIIACYRSGSMKLNTRSSPSR